ncbi:MAG: hypothetical protein ABSF97_01800 [Candidatus Sulfotelmatobacter sp.]|jgi:predicted amidophosphoribosyltransferase
MIRVVFAALLGGVMIGWIFNSSAAVIPAFVVLAVVIALANVGKLKCPYCRKSVKLGASVCHHCGREVKSLLQRVKKG